MSETEFAALDTVSVKRASTNSCGVVKFIHRRQFKGGEEMQRHQMVDPSTPGLAKSF
jgi:hypothetical protein